MSNIVKPTFNAPMHMRTVHYEDETRICPWCRKPVHPGEVHDDRASDKFGRVEEENKGSIMATRGRAAS